MSTTEEQSERSPDKSTNEEDDKVALEDNAEGGKGDEVMFEDSTEEGKCHENICDWPSNDIGNEWTLENNTDGNAKENDVENEWILDNNADEDKEKKIVFETNVEEDNKEEIISVNDTAAVEDNKSISSENNHEVNKAKSVTSEKSYNSSKSKTTNDEEDQKEKNISANNTAEVTKINHKSENKHKVENDKSTTEKSNETQIQSDSRHLYIATFPTTWTHVQIKGFIQQKDENKRLKDVTFFIIVVKSRETKTNTGEVLVKFPSNKECQIAFEMLQGIKCENKDLIVEFDHGNVKAKQLKSSKGFLDKPNVCQPEDVEPQRAGNDEEMQDATEEQSERSRDKSTNDEDDTVAPEDNAEGGKGDEEMFEDHTEEGKCNENICEWPSNAIENEWSLENNAEEDKEKKIVFETNVEKDNKEEVIPINNTAAVEDTKSISSEKNHEVKKAKSVTSEKSYHSPKSNTTNDEDQKGKKNSASNTAEVTKINRKSMTSENKHNVEKAKSTTEKSNETQIQSDSRHLYIANFPTTWTHIQIKSFIQQKDENKKLKDITFFIILVKSRETKTNTGEVLVKLPSNKECLIAFEMLQGIKCENKELIVEIDHGNAKAKQLKSSKGFLDKPNVCQREDVEPQRAGNDEELQDGNAEAKQLKSKRLPDKPAVSQSEDIETLRDDEHDEKLLDDLLDTDWQSLSPVPEEGHEPSDTVSVSAVIDLTDECTHIYMAGFPTNWSGSKVKNFITEKDNIDDKLRDDDFFSVLMVKDRTTKKHTGEVLLKFGSADDCQFAFKELKVFKYKNKALDVQLDIENVKAKLYLRNNEGFLDIPMDTSLPKAPQSETVSSTPVKSATADTSSTISNLEECCHIYIAFFPANWSPLKLKKYLCENVTGLTSTTLFVIIIKTLDQMKETGEVLLRFPTGAECQSAFKLLQGFKFNNKKLTVKLDTGNFIAKKLQENNGFLLKSVTTESDVVNLDELAQALEKQSEKPPDLNMNEEDDTVAPEDNAEKGIISVKITFEKNADKGKCNETVFEKPKEDGVAANNTAQVENDKSITAESNYTVQNADTGTKLENKIHKDKDYLCLCCKKVGHLTPSCEGFLAKRPQGRWGIVHKRQLCSYCLEAHRQLDCADRLPCGKCGGPHHRLLCEVVDGQGDEKDQQNESATQVDESMDTSTTPASSQPPEPCRYLFMSGFPPFLSPIQIKNYIYEQNAKLQSICLYIITIKSRETKKPTGEVICQFDCYYDCQFAYKKLRNLRYQSSIITVDFDIGNVKAKKVKKSGGYLDDPIVESTSSAEAHALKRKRDESIGSEPSVDEAKKIKTISEKKPKVFFKKCYMPPVQLTNDIYGLSPAYLQSLGLIPPLTNKITVKNLDKEVTAEKLREVFSLAGNVINAFITPNFKGKVTFDHPVEAVQAIAMFHKQVLYTREMLVVMDSHNNARLLPEGLMGVGQGLGFQGEPLRGVRAKVQMQPIKKALEEMGKIENQEPYNQAGPFENPVAYANPTAQPTDAQNAYNAMNTADTINTANVHQQNFMAGLTAILSANTPQAMGTDQTNLAATLQQYINTMGQATQVAGYNAGFASVAQPSAVVPQFSAATHYEQQMNLTPTTLIPLNSSVHQSMEGYNNNGSSFQNPPSQGEWATYDNTQGGGRYTSGPSTEYQSRYSSEPARYESRTSYDANRRDYPKEMEPIHSRDLQREAKKESDMLVFCNLPSSVNAQVLNMKMREVGELIFSEMTGQGRAIVRFKNPCDAGRCIKLFHRSKVDGQTIEVKYF